MNLLTGGISRFISKRIGSKVGGSLFNSSVTSCDGYDQRCGACCFDRTEANRRSMYECGSKQCKDVGSSNLGGVDTCSTIDIIGDLTQIPVIGIDKEKNRVVLLNSKLKPLVAEFESFDANYFATALLLTLGGNDLEMTVSLNPIDQHTMKQTLKPELIVRDRVAGDLLFVCDWILKCLVFGEFVDEDTGHSEPFDPDIQTRLDRTGYRSALSYKKEMGDNFESYTGLCYIGPEYINIKIDNDTMYPAIGIRCYTKVEKVETEADNGGDTWMQKFGTWFTDKFDEITNIFPVFNELRELIVTLAIVKVLRYYSFDLYELEYDAVERTEMSKFLKTKFAEQTYKFHAFELGPNRFISGGVINKYAVSRTNESERIIRILSRKSTINVDPSTPAFLTTLSELRLRMGSIVRVDTESTIGHLIIMFSVMSKFDPSWIEFYETNDSSDSSDILSIDKPIPDTVYLRLNISQTPATMARLQMCGGTVIV